MSSAARTTVKVTDESAHFLPVFLTMAVNALTVTWLPAEAAPLLSWGLLPRYALAFSLNFAVLGVCNSVVAQDA